MNLEKIDTIPKRLTAIEFHLLSDVDSVINWFANIDNPETRRAYESDLKHFIRYAGIQNPNDFKLVTRAHIIAWRKSLEIESISKATIRRKLAALSSLFNALCEANAVTHNPVKGVKRPQVSSNEGLTPAIGDHQARSLLNAPDSQSIKGKRDRAIISTLLHHGLRRAELCNLKIKDIEVRRGITHLKIHGKGNKIRYIPLHPNTAERIDTYLKSINVNDKEVLQGALFKAVKNNKNKSKDNGITADGLYKILKKYAIQTNIKISGFGPHSLRATAATNALENNADIAHVQQWLGHANIATTRMYDKRNSRPEDSPTFKVSY